MKANIVVLPGDGIGPEVLAQATAVLSAVGEAAGHEFTSEEHLIGGAAIDATGKALPEATLAACRAADAVFLGAVGGPAWEGAAERPEQGLLAIRHQLGLFANLRPIRVFPELVDLSPLRPQAVAGVDMLFAERAGVVDAAREKGIIAFGNVNDMNKEENGMDVVVTSALWDMNSAISNAIGEVKAGTFKAANYKEWTMMQKGGASLAHYYEFDARIPADAKAKVAAIQADIMAGKHTVEIIDDEPKSTF